MNFGMSIAPFFVILLWLGAWILGIYLVLRFVRAIERVADAHERIANTLTKSSRGLTDPRLHERSVE